jgi:hypothetical protein
MPIISGLTSIVGGILGGNAASRAGNAVNSAAGSASNAIGTAGNQAAAATNKATATGVSGINNAVANGQAGVTGAVNNANTVAGNLLGGELSATDPYVQEGRTGTNNLQTLAAQGFSAPTAAQVQATPGYQFQLQQGLQGLQQQLGQNGGAATGGALKALTQYGQGVASTYYQNAFNNALNSYNTNVNTNLSMAGQGLQGTGLAQQAAENFGNLYNNNTMQGNEFNAGLGLNGAQSAGNLGLQGSITAGNQNLEGTNLADQYAMEGANARAAGMIGKASGYNQAIGGIGSMAGGMFGGGGFVNPFSGFGGGGWGGSPTSGNYMQAWGL